MSKVARYLQEHLLGEVMTSADARRFFATDNSVFTVTPSIIVYPRGENDVRKTTRFAWQLAERGRIIPITARGAGTDLSGGALGEGIVVVFPAHMNRILELDQKTGVVVVEPGLNYGRLQQTLQTHERFLPPYPASIEYSTLGGAVGNNASGEKSVKYGVTRDYVRALRVVLANGEVIETKRLTKRELGKKLGLTTFEGEIYRSLDTLIEENHQLVHDLPREVSRNNAGYALAEVKHRDGSFDLTPLFVGSQGTLGIVTEVTCDTEPHNPETTLFAAFFDSIQAGCEAAQQLKDLSHVPSAIEMVDSRLLRATNELNPNLLKGVVPSPLPAMALLVEFDDATERHRKKALKQAEHIFEKLAREYRKEKAPHAQAALWKIRHSSATWLSHSNGALKPVPLIEDGIVPVAQLDACIAGIYRLLDAAQLDGAIWGHAGDGNIHVQPFFDLSQLGDRQKAFRLMDDYYALLTELGGSTTGEHNDGRLRGPYVQKLYGEQAYSLFQKVKQIFDPFGILNPGVKINVTTEDIRPLLRSSYSLEHLYNHMPRS